jgi:hypothetical protein
VPLSCPGIYALRCHATGRSWVDSSLNLDAAQNSQFFQLRQGLHRDKELQAEWDSQGGGAFAFEVLEIIPEDTPALLLRDLLSKRKESGPTNHVHKFDTRQTVLSRETHNQIF